MSNFVAADVKTLNYPFQIGPFCNTSPSDVDTLTLDWAFQIGPFIAYTDIVDVPPPPPPPAPPTPPTAAPALNGFIIDILDPKPLMTRITAGYNADFVLPLTDSMYVVTHPSTDSLIKRFADETIARLTCRFITRDWILPRPANMGVLQIVARYEGTGTVGYVTCVVTADGGVDNNGVALAAMTFTHTFTLLSGNHNQQTTRLPSGFKAQRWSVNIGLSADVLLSEVTLAGTALELATV